jgi:hypothetical protein
MTSLGDVYGGDGSDGSLRRLYVGVGLFVVGAAMLLVAIAATTTDVLVSRGLTLGQAREFGGIVGGVGVPAVFLGVLTVLPADRRTRAAAVIGATVSLLGVGLFAHAYPCRWISATCGTGSDLTLPTVGVYFLGTMTTFWCLFVGVANFKTRNDPGGTARLDVVKRGETRVVEVDRSSPGFGGVGFFGDTPDGEVATQTAGATDGGADATPVSEVGDSATGAASGRSGSNADSETGTGTGTGTGASTAGGGGRTRSSRARPWDGDDANLSRAERERRSRPAPGVKSTASSDGGGTAAASGSRPRDDAEVVGGDRAPAGDAYCGSCRHFRYVRTEDGMQPYCAAHTEVMDDMTACADWEARSG